MLLGQVSSMARNSVVNAERLAGAVNPEEEDERPDGANGAGRLDDVEDEEVATNTCPMRLLRVVVIGLL